MFRFRIAAIDGISSWIIGIHFGIARPGTSALQGRPRATARLLPYHASTLKPAGGRPSPPARHAARSAARPACPTRGRVTARSAAGVGRRDPYRCGNDAPRTPPWDQADSVPSSEQRGLRPQPKKSEVGGRFPHARRTRPRGRANSLSSVARSAEADPSEPVHEEDESSILH